MRFVSCCLNGAAIMVNVGLGLWTLVNCGHQIAVVISLVFFMPAFLGLALALSPPTSNTAYVARQYISALGVCKLKCAAICGVLGFLSS